MIYSYFNLFNIVLYRIKNDEENYDIELFCNKSEKISGELNLAELVGKNIEGDSESYRRAILKMREVKL